MKHPKPRQGADYRPIGAHGNARAANFDHAIDSQESKLAEVARAWGVDPDQYIGETADGKLQFFDAGPDESNGVTYEGPMPNSTPYIPKVRKPSDPTPGIKKGHGL